jgi:hypothetical protein
MASTYLGDAEISAQLPTGVPAGDQAQRTQLEIATQLGIDKSTLVPLLDRLAGRPHRPDHLRARRFPRDPDDDALVCACPSRV